MTRENAPAVSPEDIEHGEGDRTLSAGEVGSAEGVGGGPYEVIIGEIPAADEPTKMLWTARCREPSHDLLGHFSSRNDAETARVQHLESAHGGTTT